MVFVNIFQPLVEWFECILATSKLFFFSYLICWLYFEVGFFSSLFVFSCFCVSPSLLNRCYTLWVPQCWLLKCLHLFKYQKSILRHRTPVFSLGILFIFVSQVQNNQESQGSVSPWRGSNFLALIYLIPCICIKGPLPCVLGRVSHSQSVMNVQSFFTLPRLKLPPQTHLLISTQLNLQLHSILSLSLQIWPCWYPASKVLSTLTFITSELSTQGGCHSKVDQSWIHLFQKLLSQDLSMDVWRALTNNQILSGGWVFNLKSKPNPVVLSWF